jgi:hypothetical protein
VGPQPLNSSVQVGVGYGPILASQTIPNIKFLSFVVSEKCVIFKICTFSIKKNMILPEKKQ